jgi:hypothetical protein
MRTASSAPTTYALFATALHSTKSGIDILRKARVHLPRNTALYEDETVCLALRKVYIMLPLCASHYPLSF